MLLEIIANANRKVKEKRCFLTVKTEKSLPKLITQYKTRKKIF